MYQERDVVLVKSEFNGSSFSYVITGKFPNGNYRAIVLGSSQRRTGLTPECIERKIGTLQDCDLQNLYATVSTPSPKQVTAADTDIDVKRWGVLQNTEVNKPIVLMIHGKREVLTFNGLRPRGHKYVFTATRRTGGRYRFPLNSVVVE